MRGLVMCAATFAPSQSPCIFLCSCASHSVIACHSPTSPQAVAARLIPELSVPVAREPDQPALLVVDVFRGDDPLAVAREAAAKAGLVGDDVEAAVGVVARFAQQARVLPLVSLPVELPDGSQAPLELFKGDDVPRVVAGFLEARGLGGEYARNLEDHVGE